MIQVSKKSYKDNNLTIRLANKEDSSQIIQLQLNSLKILAAQDYTSHQIKAILNSKTQQRSILEIIFIAEVNHQAVGFAALDRYTNSLAGLFVAPEYVRQGIGTMLLQKIETEAVRLKIPILWVCASLTGYPFYKANKYQKLSRSNILVNRTLVPCVQMKKRLIPSTKVEIAVNILYYALITLIIFWSLVIFLASF